MPAHIHELYTILNTLKKKRINWLFLGYLALKSIPRVTTRWRCWTGEIPVIVTHYYLKLSSSFENID